jgi:hypothetical protein
MCSKKFVEKEYSIYLLMRRLIEETKRESEWHSIVLQKE